MEKEKKKELLKGGDNMAKSKVKVANEIKKQYMKAWRDRNKDKTKLYQERYWLKKAEEFIASQKEGE